MLITTIGKKEHKQLSTKKLWKKYSNNKIHQLNYLEKLSKKFQGKPLKWVIKTNIKK